MAELSGNVPLPSALGGLARLRAPGGGLFASSGDLFREAEFGRDSIQAALDLIQIAPDISRTVILRMAALQGTRVSPRGPRSSEEEPGKIHHEYRSKTINGQLVSPESQKLLESLSQRWSGTPDQMTYYGTADATPLYVRLVDQYCRLYGDAILKEQYTDKEGRKRTIADSVRDAVMYVERRIDASALGLYDWQRINTNGIEYQTWTDGKTSLIDPNGRALDPDRPIATPDIQGHAYDALIGAARLLGGSDAARWEKKATDLRDRALALFWMPRQAYMAMAVTLDDKGRPRRVDTLSALGAELLDTGFFDGLPPAQRDSYVAAIAGRVLGPEFLTPAGVRCLDRRYARVAGYPQYQGSLTTWPKQSYAIARGLSRQGLQREAVDLEIRLLNAVNIANGYPEFFYLDKRGGVVYHPVSAADPALSRRHHSATIEGTNIPDAMQAWTVSALLAIKWHIGHSRAQVHVVSNSAQIAGFRRRIKPTPVNRDLGKQHEQQLLRRSGLSDVFWTPQDAEPPPRESPRSPLGWLRGRRGAALGNAD